ncbi:ATP-binding cassette domain-containing protein [Burkholderia vietnamiensis]|uniref:ATP-binding cassette domain-containing protein n=1 Tax=Burkholderia vietnamiensis TaxID=60552 RepID=UPI001CAE1676|nr:ATP-binding cassette domain-containing protein [Burkholderia vietnamiensis]CAG9228777.1 ABC transporter [Burkholderia vietnamiensis]HDR9086373.1 ATP-binding cassette domain-containing protein [Burkholderia vietnamiensis]
MSTYTIDKRFHTRVARSQRVVEVAEAFGLGLDDKEFVIFDQLKLDVEQGDVVYITGQSGSGKSLLLRELSEQMGAAGKKVANLDHVAINPDVPLIDQIGTSTNDAIRLLSIAGLNDAYLFIRKPGELSDGQRYRFKLAKAIESQADVWVADEFMAVLDRTAAKVIAYAVQKTARKVGATVIVATTHLDLVEDLQPSLYIEKRYREKLRVETFKELGAAAAGERVLTRDEAFELMKRMA